jgi:serine/alanine adding enzyme
MTAAAALQPLEVASLNGDHRAWDEVVTYAPGSSFCQLSGWREILSDVLGAECLYWTAADTNGALQGILPLVRVRSRMFGHYLVSMPFLNDGGALGSQAARERLIQEAVQEARRSGVDLLELRTRDPGAVDLPVSTRRITVLLPLPPDADTLFKRFPAKLRSQIRRPMKEGLEVRFGAEQREPFYELFARARRDLGSPVLPRAFFERVAATFSDLVMFGVVYRGAQPLAGGCGFVWRGEFELNWAGALRESRRIAANMLLYWGLMQHAIARGVQVFNFGRCAPGGSTHQFKKQWGGMDVPLAWLHYTAPGRGARAIPSSDSASYSWGPRLWRRLPLFVANRLGPRLVRFLP